MAEKIPSSEKVSVNMNVGTLAQIDLLVDQGYYSNRSDFINQAVRSYLATQEQNLEITLQKERDRSFPLFLGINKFGKADFEKWKASGKKVDLKGYGILILPEDCDDLIQETVQSISVRGKVYCSERIRKIYLPTL